MNILIVDCFYIGSLQRYQIIHSEANYYKYKEGKILQTKYLANKIQLLPLLIFLLPLVPKDTVSHMKIVSRNTIMIQYKN